MQFKGVDSIITQGNAMRIYNHAGYVQFDTLVAYTVNSTGDTTHVAVSFRTIAANRYGFTSGAYNEGHTLVIEGKMKSLEQTTSLQGLKWSTYYGGSADVASDIKLDNGNAYITGNTSSQNLPKVTRINPAQGGASFLTKFDNTDALKWSVYYGGSTGSGGTRIAFNSTSNIFVCGGTSDNDFANVQPGGAYQFTPNFTTNTFNSYIAEFDPVTASIIWKTYFDGQHY